MNIADDGATRNLLLAHLPVEVMALLVAHLERVDLRVKQLLYNVNQPVTHVYFPLRGVISLLTVLHDGTIVEIGTVGNEGFAGVQVMLHAEEMDGRAFVQIPGAALRMPVADFTRLVDQLQALRDVLLRYTQTLFTQVALCSACNRVHSIEQRCARWLLMAQDRAGGEYLPLTQEWLAQMLGVRRAGVNEVATALQAEGLIRYRHGKITILDRVGLEAHACECYAQIQAEYTRLLRGAGAE